MKGENGCIGYSLLPYCDLISVQLSTVKHQRDRRLWLWWIMYTFYISLLANKLYRITFFLIAFQAHLQCRELGWVTLFRQITMMKRLNLFFSFSNFLSSLMQSAIYGTAAFAFHASDWQESTRNDGIIVMFVYSLISNLHMYLYRL